jgi:hypothetical protein
MFYEKCSTYLSSGTKVYFSEERGIESNVAHVGLFGSIFGLSYFIFMTFIVFFSR